MIYADFLILLILAFAAFGIGSVISGSIHRRQDINAIFSWGIETALGLGCMALLTFFLGILKLLYWWILWPVFVVAAIYGILCLRRLLLDRFRPRLSISLIYIIPTLIVAFLVVLIILDHIAPAIWYDDLKYHLALPRRYVESHKLYPFSTTFHSYWPGNLEMLITDAMMLGTDSAGRGILLLMLASLVGILAGFTRQIFRSFTGAVPAILLFTLPTVLSQSKVASTDLAGSFWMLGAIVLLVLWLDSSETKFCILSGAFMGFALGSKYNFMYEVFTVALIVIVYGIIFHRPFLTAKNIKVIGLTAAVAVLVGSPWYIRNWILVGNPVYPFYYSIFGGENWSEGLDKEFMVWLKSDYSRPALSKISLSLRGSHFYILYLLPFSLIAIRRRRQILIISLGLSLFFAWYYLGTYQLRFGITWQVLLTMAISYGLLETTRYWRWSHFIILAILCGFLIYSLPRQYRSAKPRINVALGRQSREEYMVNYPGSDDTYPLIDYANKNLPEDTILATFWYNAGHYYSKHEYLMLNPLVSGVIDHTTIESAQQYAQEVMDTGATHLLYAVKKAKFFISPPRTKRYHKLHNWHRYFIENHTKLIKRNQEAFLYEITKKPGKTVLPSTFVQSNYSITPIEETSWEEYSSDEEVNFYRDFSSYQKSGYIHNDTSLLYLYWLYKSTFNLRQTLYCYRGIVPIIGLQFWHSRPGIHY